MNLFIPDVFLYFMHQGNHPLPCWQNIEGLCSEMLNLKSSEHRGTWYTGGEIRNQ